MMNFRLSAVVLLLLFLTSLEEFCLVAQGKLESETAQTAEENAKDKGGLLEEEYADIDFGKDDDEEEEDEGQDARFLPSNMLSVVMIHDKERCFFEEIMIVPATLRGAWFTTAESTPDLLVKVRMAKGKETVIYEETHSTDTGGFTVTADLPGTYAYCFKIESYATDVVVTFAVDVSSPHKPTKEGGSSAVKPEHIYPLQRSATNLYNYLRSLESELEVILLRIDRHVQTQDSTELRVSLLTFVETLAIAIITAFQIYYVRRLVNKSRQWV
jgi:hypothetical protein